MLVKLGKSQLKIDRYQHAVSEAIVRIRLSRWVLKGENRFFKPRDLTGTFSGQQDVLQGSNTIVKSLEMRCKSINHFSASFIKSE